MLAHYFWRGDNINREGRLSFDGCLKELLIRLFDEPPKQG